MQSSNDSSGLMASMGCLPLMAIVMAIVAAVLFPVFSHAREKARMTSSASNLKVIGLASLQFAQDNNENLPPTDTLEHFKSALAPYVPDANPKLFIEPGADVPYIVNPDVSRHSIAKIPHPEATMLAREAVPHPDGLIMVLYVDGHVKAEHPK